MPPKEWVDGLPGDMEAELIQRFPAGTPMRGFDGPASPLQGAGWYSVLLVKLRQDCELYTEEGVSTVIFCKEQLFNVRGGGVEAGAITGWPARALRIEVSNEPHSDAPEEESWMPMGVWRTVESEIEADYEESERGESYSYSYTNGEEQGLE